VLKHTRDDIKPEFILVDNSDREDVTPFIHDLPGLTLIKNDTNRGFAAANNQGLERAFGEFVLFLNNDTLFTEDTLGKIIDFQRGLKKPALIGCKLLNADGSHQESIFDFDSLNNELSTNFFLWQLFPRSPWFNRFHLNYTAPDTTQKVDVVKGCFIFGSLQDVRKLKGFDEDFFFYSEEYDLCYRFHLSGGETWYFPQTSIIHLGGASTNDIKLFSVKNMALSKLIFYKKHNTGLRRYAYYFLHYTGYAIRVPVYFIMGILTFSPNQFAKSKNYLISLFQYPGKSSRK
jgi:GT2 family glycosyltransferase